MQEDKDKHLAEEKPTLAKRLMKAQEEAMEAAIVGKQLGISPQAPEGGGQKADPIQAQVVSSALTQMNNMVSQANEIAKDKQKEVDQARKEADEARANLYTTQLAQIQSMQKELIDTIQKVREQGTPEAAMGVIGH